MAPNYLVGGRGEPLAQLASAEFDRAELLLRRALVVLMRSRKDDHVVRVAGLRVARQICRETVAGLQATIHQMTANDGEGGQA